MSDWCHQYRYPIIHATAVFPMNSISLNSKNHVACSDWIIKTINKYIITRLNTLWTQSILLIIVCGLQNKLSCRCMYRASEVNTLLMIILIMFRDPMVFYRNSKSMKLFPFYSHFDSNDLTATKCRARQDNVPCRGMGNFVAIRCSEMKLQQSEDFMEF